MGAWFRTEKELMKCVICKHGETQPGNTTITLERGGATLVVKSVPARICGNCGEAYVDEETAHRLLATAREALRAGVQVDVRDFLATASSDERVS
jgi:YgiT-type zinc finger domain-containing protein